MKMERFYANMKRFYGVVGIGLGYVGLIFLLVYGFLMYKENNQMVARGIFLEVIEEESMPIQKKMFIHFDAVSNWIVCFGYVCRKVDFRLKRLCSV